MPDPLNPPYSAHWRDYYAPEPLGPDQVLPKPPNPTRLWNSKWIAENHGPTVRAKQRRERIDHLQKQAFYGPGMMGIGMGGMGMGMMPGMMGMGGMPMGGMGMSSYGYPRYAPGG
jgi:hypothetical protein